MLALSPSRRRDFEESLSPKAKALLKFCWEFWARPAQLPPEISWTIWLILAGRGFGKSRTGAETVRMWAERGGERIALLGATFADCRDVMIEGPSGVLAVSPPWNRPKWEVSKHKLTWPNGTVAMVYSADEPDRLRGPQHTKAWVDEICAFRFMDAWDQLQFGMRLPGTTPQTVVTTTPRPIPILKRIMKRRGTTVTRGSTYDNRENLHPEFFAEILSQFEGSRLGAQELNAEILDDVEGALWSRGLIERTRVLNRQMCPKLERIVVGVDPATTEGADRDETGIVVVGRGSDGHGYVLGDYSLAGSPSQWAEAVLLAHDQSGATCLVVEVNKGGALVTANIRNYCNAVGRECPRIKTVNAGAGKETRAEPFVTLYETSRIHHVGYHGRLEDQLCSWVPGETRKSPDRMDGMIWALVELFPNVGKFRASAEKPDGF